MRVRLLQSLGEPKKIPADLWSAYRKSNRNRIENVFFVVDTIFPRFYGHVCLFFQSIRRVPFYSRASVYIFDSSAGCPCIFPFS